MRVHQFGLADLRAVAPDGIASLLRGIGYAGALPSA